MRQVSGNSPVATVSAGLFVNILKTDITHVAIGLILRLTFPAKTVTVANRITDQVQTANEPQLWTVEPLCHYIDFLNFNLHVFSRHFMLQCLSSRSKQVYCCYPAKIQWLGLVCWWRLWRWVLAATSNSLKFTSTQLEVGIHVLLPLSHLWAWLWLCTPSSITPSLLRIWITCLVPNNRLISHGLAFHITVFVRY